MDCNLFVVTGATSQGSVGYMVEKMTVGARTALKVTLLTNADGTRWHVKLTVDDVSTQTFDLIDVKLAHIAGDSQPEVTVGYRINGTGHILDYDIVELRPGGGLDGVGSRSLDHGSAVIDGTTLVDYVPYPDANTPSYFDRNEIGIGGGVLRIINNSHAPERGPGNLAPPP